METINQLFGLHTETLLGYQVFARGIVVLAAFTLFIAASGVRRIVIRSGFDYLIFITVGAIIARSVVTGAQPFFFSLGIVLLVIIIQQSFSRFAFESQIADEIADPAFAKAVSKKESWTKEKILQTLRHIAIVRDGKESKYSLHKIAFTKQEILATLRTIIINRDSKLEKAYVKSDEK